MPKPFVILRVKRLCDSALRAWEQGATADQLSEYIQGIDDLITAYQEGGEDERDDEAHRDVGAPPRVDREP